MSQSSGFLGSLLRLGLPLLKKVIAPFGLTAAMSAADAGIQKKICGYGQRGSKVGEITLVISSKDMSDIMEVIKVLEDKGLLVKRTAETTANEIQL